jgi:hypothetical protein
MPGFVRPIEHMMSHLSEVIFRLVAGVPAVLDVDDVLPQPSQVLATNQTRAVTNFSRLRMSLHQPLPSCTDSI